VIDMGEHEVGQVAVAHFIVANRGGRDLIVDQIRSSCVCAGLEIEEDGKFLSVESLRLKAGQETKLALRISVRGQPGTAMRVTVGFHTNDPDCPEAALQAVVPRVTGGIDVSPTTVIFGTVAAGANAREVLEIRDAASTPRAITKVASTSPDVFTARLLPATDESGVKPQGTSGVLIGRVEVMLRPRISGPVDGAVLIYVNDDKRLPHSVPVTGRIAALVEVTPSELVLPRASASGPVYFGKCICRTFTGKPLTLSVDAAPRDISVKTSVAPWVPGSSVIQIEWKPQSHNGQEALCHKVLRFRARVGDEETTFSITVTCRRAGAF
jgi:hypothetical protein